MLGKTNLILKEAEPAEDVTILQELVQTYYPHMKVIGVANGKIFAIKDDTYGEKRDETILYGDDLEHMTETEIKAEQVLYANETYYFLGYAVSSDSQENGRPQIYTSKDLNSFQRIIIDNGIYQIDISILHYNKEDSKVYFACKPIGESLFKVEYGVLHANAADDKVILTKEHKIVIFKGNYPGNINRVEIFENNVLYFNWEDSNKNSGGGLVYPTSINNYIAVPNNIDGYIKGYYWYATRDAIYRSINGTDYTLVNKISNKSVKIMNYHGNILIIVRTGQGYSAEKGDSFSFAIASKWENVAAAMSHCVTFTPQYCVSDIFLVNDVFYAAADAGLFIKAYFGEEPEEQPADEVLIKTLAAREALEKANRYTDERYALFEARIAALEALVLQS